MNRLELKVPPLLLVLGFALVMALVDRTLPMFELSLPWAQGLGPVLMALGAACAAAGVWAFRRAGTTVNPTRPETSREVVREGIYAYSRNPMYLGFALALLGWAWLLSHGLALALLPGFVLYMNRFQILPEERVLARHFGPAYDSYRAQVRRWI